MRGLKISFVYAYQDLIQNKIVIQRQDGSLMRGSPGISCPTRMSFICTNGCAAGFQAAVCYSQELKAVFFVKDFTEIAIIMKKKNSTRPNQVWGERSRWSFWMARF
jgi:hypothetical protein